MSFLLGLHIVVCVLLVISILLQAGRGGGLAESFSSAESMFGTQTNQFMVRVTTVLCTIFLSTSLILAFYSSKLDKSLMSNAKLPKAVEPVKEEQPTIKIEEPKPITPETVPAEGIKVDDVKVDDVKVDDVKADDVGAVTTNQAQ